MPESFDIQSNEVPGLYHILEDMNVSLTEAMKKLDITPEIPLERAA